MKYSLILACLSAFTLAFISAGCSDGQRTTTTTTEQSSVVAQPTESTTTQTTIQKN